MRNQNGSILFYILIAVVLFAALGYSVAQMSRFGAEEVGDEKASIYADSILQYAQSIREAVNMLRISNGCEAEDISFENNFVTGYTNGNAPSDYSCHVFHPDGGGMAWIQAESHLNDGTPYHFESRRAIGSGSSSNDLIMGLAHINLNICKKINQKLHDYTGDPYRDPDNFSVWGTGRFTGSYGTGGHLNYPDADEHEAACFKSQDSQIYHFYQVLIAR